MFVIELVFVPAVAVAVGVAAAVAGCFGVVWAGDFVVGEVGSGVFCFVVEFDGSFGGFAVPAFFVAAVPVERVGDSVDREGGGRSSVVGVGFVVLWLPDVGGGSAFVDDAFGDGVASAWASGPVDAGVRFRCVERFVFGIGREFGVGRGAFDA